MSIRLNHRTQNRSTLMVIIILSIFSAFTASPAGGEETPKSTVPPKDAKELYDSTKVWTLHMTFNPEQWAKMEPARTENPGGPFSRGFGNNRSPARAAELFAPVVLSHGDGNRDGKLSIDEFTALGRAWFKAWDKNGFGKLFGMWDATKDAQLGYVQLRAAMEKSGPK